MKAAFPNSRSSDQTETGAPTNTTAMLEASFTTVYFIDPNTPLVFPPLADCDPASDTVSIDVLSGPFNFCSADANRMASAPERSEEHTSELQSLMRISYAVSFLTKKTHIQYN